MNVMHMQVYVTGSSTATEAAGWRHGQRR